jgi:hypothetical protein
MSRHAAAMRSKEAAKNGSGWGVGAELHRSEVLICLRRLHSAVSDGLSANQRPWSSNRRLESAKGRKWRRQHDLEIQHGRPPSKVMQQPNMSCSNQPCCTVRSCCLLHFLPFTDSSLLLLLHVLRSALSPSE